LDYERIPFRCKKFHDHSPLFRDCPKNAKIPSNKGKEELDEEGFTKIPSKQKSRRKPSTFFTLALNKIANKFQALSEVEEEGPHEENPPKANDQGNSKQSIPQED
jgi:hypothetical protein